MGRRFPASTNPLTRRNRQRHLGLVCEVGVKTVMRKLEEGTAAAQEEMDALIRYVPSTRSRFDGSLDLTFKIK